MTGALIDMGCLGQIPREDAHTLQRALRIAVDSGELWADDSYRAVVALRRELACALLEADVREDA